MSLQIVTKIAWAILGIVALAMILSMFYPQYQKYLELQQHHTALENRMRAQQEHLKKLKHYQAQMKSNPKFVENIAREDLGYAKPGEFVIKFVDDSRATVRAAQ